MSPDGQQVQPLGLSSVREHAVFRRVSASLDRGVSEDNDLVVVAVSGGGDSTALALLVDAWRVARSRMAMLAYFDHEHEPKRHECEWRQVKGLARCLGMPAARGSAGLFGAIEGRSQEEVWRNRRYAFLLSLTGSTGVVVTGHTMDDVAETFVMAAMRGGSGSAMAGPRRRTGRIVRPLLDVRRETLRDLLRVAGVGWIEDPENVGSRRRAVVRSHLMPLVTRLFGPRAVEGLARSAAMTEEWTDAVDAQARRACGMCVRHRRHDALLDLQAWRDYPLAVRRRVLRRVVATWCASPEALLSGPVDELLGLCESDRSWHRQLPGGAEATRSGGVVRIGRAAPVPRIPETAIPIPGHVDAGAWRIEVSTRWIPPGIPLRLPAGKTVALLDRDGIREPLSLRRRQPGDRCVPMGMEGAVSLKKYLRDHGVPRWERWSIPVLCDAGERILWVPGIVRSRIAPVGAHTTRIVLLRGVPKMMHEEAFGG